MIKKHTIGVVIPCYQVAQNVVSVIEGIPKYVDAIIAVNDAIVLGRQVDGVLLVIRLGSTPRRLVAEAVASFGATGVRILGCVLTGSSDEDNVAGYAYGGQRT